MRIDELLMGTRNPAVWPSPEGDALTEEGVLAEAALLDVRLDLVNSDAWMLLDCRGALQLVEGNTAVVIVHGVTKFSWLAAARDGRTWWSVMGWYPVAGSRSLRIGVELGPDGDLVVAGLSGEFFVGRVPGGDSPPPDFTTATDAEMRAGLAQWSSEFDVLGASAVGCSW